MASPASTTPSSPKSERSSFSSRKGTPLNIEMVHSLTSSVDSPVVRMGPPRLGYTPREDFSGARKFIRERRPLPTVIEVNEQKKASKKQAKAVAAPPVKQQQRKGKFFSALSALIDEDENFSEPSNDVKKVDVKAYVKKVDVKADVKADVKKVDVKKVDVKADTLRAELPKDVKTEIKKFTEDVDVFPKKPTYAVKLRVVPKQRQKHVLTFVGRECDFPALAL